MIVNAVDLDLNYVVAAAAAADCVEVDVDDGFDNDDAVGVAEMRLAVDGVEQAADASHVTPTTRTMCDSRSSCLFANCLVSAGDGDDRTTCLWW